MTESSFEIGDLVLLVPDGFGDEGHGGTYEIVAHVPTDGKTPRYKVKSIVEPFSRVVPEGLMLALFGPPRPAFAIGSKVSIRAHNEPAEVTLAVTSATRMSLGAH